MAAVSDPEVIRLAKELMQRLLHTGARSVSVTLNLTLAPPGGGAMQPAVGLLVVDIDTEGA
ncbi:hypothetical protein [Magnetospirillum aberrantis]|uniref:Uncharacterized protein n=1 Tax=Magnetospirillum aberrantis SpK TaxID=908842 RepID=A0A7C9UTF4_9PROT|nr:hypothetical protein [Magnetospirillum aberrantis]NFV80047.1 hypothetical protein [Magnetospirillum aberrantis SpK]